MPKPSSRSLASGPISDARASARQSAGIFGPDWHRWRGATLHIELEDEPPAIMRLDEVKPALTTKGEDARQALLTELDSALKPVGQRTLPWPPSGSVRVLRAP